MVDHTFGSIEALNAAIDEAYGAGLSDAEGVSHQRFREIDRLVGAVRELGNPDALCVLARFHMLTFQAQLEQGQSECEGPSRMLKNSPPSDG
jgi:hypothetical protein